MTIGVQNFVEIGAMAPERTWLGPFLSPTLPAGWSRIPSQETANGAAWRSRDGVMVVVSGAVELDERRWVHVSLSRRDRMPSHEDLTRIKRLFIGPDRRALQLFVPEDEHVNFHRFCLHLWHCLDGDGLPDFRAGGLV